MRPGDDLDSLIDELRKSLEEFPGEPKFMRLLALSLADKGRNESEKPNRYFAEAAEIYEELLKDSNSYIDGLLDTYTLMGEYEKAEKKAAEQPPLRNSREVLLASIEYKRAFDTGYKGRKAITELLVMNPKINDLILGNAPAIAIREKARELGMVTMREDGVRAILNGETTMEEVLKYT